MKENIYLLFNIALLYIISYNYVITAKNETYTWKNVVTGAGGGFVPGIIFNAKQKDLIYARTDIGGAYRWDPTAKHWVPLLDFLSADDWNLMGVDSLASDPVDPKRVYIAAGTYTNSWSPTNGAILRSNDTGNTWQRTDLPFKVGGNMPGRSMGERLAIDPNDNKIVYFGARSGNGLWKSTDYGEKFSKVSSFTADGKYSEKPGDPYLGDSDGEVWVVFDPKSGSSGKHSQSIYVGTADKEKSIFHSADGGSTWSAVADQPTGYLPHHGILASDGTLYITYSNGAGPYDGTKGEVWKLETQTGVWHNISPVKSDSNDDYFGYGGVSVDPKNPKIVMVAALNSWWPDEIFFRTTDGGATWTRIWDWTSYPSRSLRYEMDISAAPWLNFGNKNPVEPEPAIKIGWMVGALAIDPHNSDHMLYGTGATIYGTDDLTNWDKNVTFHITVRAAGIEETSVTEVISPLKGANLYSTMGDVSGFRHDDLDKPPKAMYSIPYAGTYAHIDYAELKPEFLVIVGYGKPSNNPPIRSSGFSYDSGANWFQGNNDPQGMGEGGGTVAAAADASHVVWSPKTGGVFYTTDNGNSWHASTGIGPQGAVASDRVNAKKFYGYANGAFHVSTDSGATFKETVKIAVNDSYHFKAVPGHEGEIWFAAGSGGLYHSADSGATFTKVTGVERADTIGYGKAKTGSTYPAIYVSAVIDKVHAIYRSDDKASTWVHINDKTHQYGTVQCITGDSRVYGRVYFGTNGRGIIYGDPK